MNLIRKYMVLLITIFFLQFDLAAQGNDQKTWKDKIFFGGNFALQFGTITDIEISPLVGYWVTPRLAGGIGGIYEFYKRNDFIKMKTHIYGGRAFSKYVLIQDLSRMIPIGFTGSINAHLEYEALSLENKYFKYPFNEDGRFLLNSYLIGGGLSQQIGRRAAIHLTVLWNMNETEQSPYSNPIIRIGFTF